MHTLALVHHVGTYLLLDVLVIDLVGVNGIVYFSCPVVDKVVQAERADIVCTAVVGILGGVAHTPVV